MIVSRVACCFDTRSERHETALGSDLTCQMRPHLSAKVAIIVSRWIFSVIALGYDRSHLHIWITSAGLHTLERSYHQTDRIAKQ